MRRLRGMTVANDRIVVGDLYRGSGSYSGIIVMANHGTPKGDLHFCGTAVKVDKYSSCPVGVLADHWPVRSFTWCRPGEIIELHN